MRVTGHIEGTPLARERVCGHFTEGNRVVKLAQPCLKNGELPTAAGTASLKRLRNGIHPKGPKYSFTDRVCPHELARVVDDALADNSRCLAAPRPLPDPELPVPYCDSEVSDLELDQIFKDTWDQYSSPDDFSEVSGISTPSASGGPEATLSASGR